MGLMQQAKSMVTGNGMPSREAFELREMLASPLRRLKVIGLDEHERQDRVEFLAGMHRLGGEVTPIQRDRVALDAETSSPLVGRIEILEADMRMWSMGRRDANVSLEVDGVPVEAAMRLPRDIDGDGIRSLFAEMKSAKDVSVSGREAVFETKGGSVREFQIDSMKIDGREVALGLDRRKAQDAGDRMVDIGLARSSQIRQVPKGWKAGTVKGPYSSHEDDVAASAMNAARSRGTER